MSADLLQRTAQAVELGKASGADDVWASVQQSRDVEFESREGALEKVKDTTSMELSVRLYVDGRYSSHQTTDLASGRLDDFIREAVAITRALEPDDHRRITSPELFAKLPENDLQLIDPAVAGIDRDQRLAWCAELDAATHSDERVISATAGVYDGSATRASVSSNGFSATDSSTYCWLGASVTLRDQGDKRAEDGFYAGGRFVSDLPVAADIGRTALERALSRLGAEKGPSFRGTMVVDARAAASLIGRLLGPANARNVQQGRSFWSGASGKALFSPALTIVDDPLLVRGLGSRRFDSEGVAAKRLPLVTAGVVDNIYVDTYYGSKGGLKTTTGSPSNRVVAPGDASLNDLLAAAGEGVYVTSWLGGNADSTTGDFSLGLRGHMIENGKLGRPVGEMNVTGNLVDLFARLDAVGNDPYPYSTTLSPSMVFTDVDFSGA